jgi:hypothetical protein
LLVVLVGVSSFGPNLCKGGFNDCGLREGGTPDKSKADKVEEEPPQAEEDEEDAEVEIDRAEVAL